jgi:hypothetical protein
MKCLLLVKGLDQWHIECETEFHTWGWENRDGYTFSQLAFIERTLMEDGIYSEGGGSAVEWKLVLL